MARWSSSRSVKAVLVEEVTCDRPERSSLPTLKFKFPMVSIRQSSHHQINQSFRFDNVMSALKKRALFFNVFDSPFHHASPIGLVPEKDA